MKRIFIGTDKRQPIAFTALAQSIYCNASEPVQITPLVLSTLPLKRTGLTEFTYSRYMVPWLCNYEGIALFLDADMIVDGDIAELFKQVNHESPGVSVVAVEKRFEWPSLMLFNCQRCRKLTPEYIEMQVPQNLSDWSDDGIGGLPVEWNYCVGYDNPEMTPKLIHYTAGIPIWPETRDCKYNEIWHKYHRQANGSVSYQDLMGTSVHVDRVKDGRIKE